MPSRQAKTSLAVLFTSLLQCIDGKIVPRVAVAAAFSLLLTGSRSDAQTVHFDGADKLHGSASIDPAGKTGIGTTTFESAKVGTVSPTTLSLRFKFDAEGTLGSTAVVTKGAKNLDFTDAGTGTCKADTAYAANATCTVNVTFKPRAAGPRFGAVKLLDNHGKLLANAYLNGSGAEPLATFLPATIGGGLGLNYFAALTGVAVDGSGDIFVTDQGENTVAPAVLPGVTEIVAVDGSIPSSPTVYALGSGFVQPTGLALDGSGNIYVADPGNGAVMVVPSGCVVTYCTVTTLGSGFATPNAVAVDGSGNVFVTDSTNNAVYEILAGCTTTSCTIHKLASTFAFADPNGVAVDGNGNVYVVDTGNVAIEEIVTVDGKIPATNPTVLTLTTAFNQPWGIAVMPNGSLLVSDAGEGRVYEMLAVGGSVPTTGAVILNVSEGYWDPQGVASDGKGNVFIADFGHMVTDSSEMWELSLAANPSIVFPTSTPAFSVDSTDGTQTLTAVNAGTLALSAQAPGLTAPAANFTLLAGSGTPPDCTASFSLAPGGACNLNIEFAPTATGNPLNGTLVLTDNSLGATKATQTIALSGIGLAPVIVVAPASLPEAAVGIAYTQTITASGGPTPFSYAVTAGSLPPGLTLSTGGSLSGTPTANGSFSFTVTASGSSIGTGTFKGSQAYVVAVSENVGIVSVGSTSTGTNSVRLTIQTSGTLNSIAALTLGASGLDFSNAGGGTCAVGTSYSVGNTCTVNVGFKPRAPGARNGAIEILNASGKPLATAYVQGTGYGPRVNFLSATQTNLGTGFNSPTGVAEDGHGNIFVTDGGNTSLYELEAGCTPSACTKLTLISSFVRPNSVAVDGAGNIFVADAGAGEDGYGALYELLAGCTPSACTVLSLGSNFSNPGGFSGFYSPTGVAVDGSGNIFLTDAGNPGGDSGVYELQTGCTPSACTVLTLNTDLSFPQAVAVDGNGNIFVGGYGGLAELLAPCTPVACTVNTLDGSSSPLGVAVDGSGNLFATDSFANTVSELLAVGGSVPSTDPTTLTLASGFNNPIGVAVDPSGNVLVADTENSRVAMLNLSTPPTANFPTLTSVGSIDTTDGPRTVQVIDGGNSPLVFAPPTSGGNPSYPANFPVNSADHNLCSSSAPLGVNSICDVSANFDPTAAGANSGSVVLTDNTLNQSNATQSIALTGQGKAPAPIVTLSTKTLAFGSEDIGAITASQTVTLTNTGTASLSITSIAITGTNASSFVFANSCGTTLAAGANCTIHGHFGPLSSGALTAAITITDNAAGSPQSVALTGTGVAAAAVKLSTTSLAFGSVNIGSISGSTVVTLTNSGSAALSITSINVTGADASSFVFVSGCGTSLAAGANCTIHGHFGPLVAGALTAAITITDNAAGSPQSVALSGTGVAIPLVKLSATSFSFGSVNFGSTSGSAVITLTNSGSAALSITSIAVTGADASSFDFANSCGTTLAAGANCTIHGHFGPLAAGALTAAITITDNAAGSPQSIALSGTGVAIPIVSLSATKVSFGTVKVGAISGSETVTLTNTGDATLTITSIVVTGTNASSFVFANSCGSTLAAGANCTIHGHFGPTTTGALSASITITDNAGGSTQTIALSGTGD